MLSPLQGLTRETSLPTLLGLVIDSYVLEACQRRPDAAISAPSLRIHTGLTGLRLPGIDAARHNYLSELDANGNSHQGSFQPPEIRKEILVGV